MSRPFWSGTITFGLVSVPVNLFPAYRNTRASLRLLGPEGVPLSRRYYSAKTGRDLNDEEMLRGYEIGEDEYVLVTDEELERLQPEKTRDIDVRRFVEHDSIPPIYFERSYFLTPSGNSDKAYRLLANTMEKIGRMGIATFVMRGKEYLVAILAEKGILRAETLRFADELRTPEDIGLPRKVKAPQTKVKEFEKFIKSHSEARPSKTETRDEETGRLVKLARKKLSRKKDVVEVEPEKSAHGKVVDIMDVLKKSIAASR
ncbi:MAG TPA: Ku protein [Blastocatellia bacterium]|nr:Ku protein [Blastocatellia bacterium]